MVKCDRHNKGMLKVGRRDYICATCNGMTKGGLIQHLNTQQNERNDFENIEVL